MGGGGVTTAGGLQTQGLSGAALSGSVSGSVSVRRVGAPVGSAPGRELGPPPAGTPKGRGGDSPAEALDSSVVLALRGPEAAGE